MPVAGSSFFPAAPWAPWQPVHSPFATGRVHPLFPAGGEVVVTAEAQIPLRGGRQLLDREPVEGMAGETVALLRRGVENGLRLAVLALEHVVVTARAERRRFLEECGRPA